MKAYIVSDIHVKHPHDQASLFLKKFLQLCESTHIDRVYFLGDIFDHMVGEHQQYIKKYDFFFNAIKKLILQNKEIYFFEGNHDFHLIKVFEYFLEKEKLDENKFIYSKNYVIHEFGDNKVWFGHGDDLDYNNMAYKRWKKIYTSNQFNFLISKIFSFEFLQKFGSWASDDSKKRGKKTFNLEMAREKYRQGAREIAQLGVNYIIAGHTHIAENFEDNSTSYQFTYLNNGLPVRDGFFISYDEQFKLERLESFF